MDRRDVLGWLSAGVAAGGARLVSAPNVVAQVAQPARPASPRGLPPLKITDITTILTAPNRIRLVIVKVSTSEPAFTAWAVRPSPSGPMRCIRPLRNT
jgi:mannonate dehydratase